MYTQDDIEVAILTYNRSNYLKESVQSILNQSIKVKLTIVDNNSIDDTEDYVKSLMANNPNINYYKQPEHVPFRANFKTACDLADRKYIMFFHDDDICHPQYLEFALKAINKIDNVDLVLSLITEFKDGESIEHKKLDSVKYSIFKNKFELAIHSYVGIFADCSSIMFPSVIYKVENIKNKEFDNATYGKIADKPYVISTMNDGVCVQLRETEFLKYRVHTGQDSLALSNDPSEINVINHNKFFKNFMNETPLSKRKFDIFSPRWIYFLNCMRQNYSKSDSRKFVTRAFLEGGCNLYCWLSYSSPLRFLFKKRNKHLERKYLYLETQIQEEILKLN